MGACDADHCGFQNIRDDPESYSQSQLPVSVGLHKGYIESHTKVMGSL